MTKASKITAHLLSARSVTQMQATNLYNYTRLAVHIERLRKKVWDIHTELEGESRYAVYTLLYAPRATV